jgi:hypothetical protein
MFNLMVGRLIFLCWRSFYFYFLPIEFNEFFICRYALSISLSLSLPSNKFQFNFQIDPSPVFLPTCRYIIAARISTVLCQRIVAIDFFLPWECWIETIFTFCQVQLCVCSVATPYPLCRHYGVSQRERERRMNYYSTL